MSPRKLLLSSIALALLVLLGLAMTGKLADLFGGAGEPGDSATRLGHSRVAGDLGESTAGEEDGGRELIQGKDPENAAATEGIRVRGRLLAEDGSPLGAETFTVIKGKPPYKITRGQPAMLVDELPPGLEVTSESDGLFEFSWPRERDAWLSFGPRWVRRAAPPYFAASRQDLDLGELRLRRGGRLRGQVLSTSGQPVPGVELSVFSMQFFLTLKTRSGADGRFQIGGLAPGMAQLVVNQDGFASYNKRLEVLLRPTPQDVVVRLNEGFEVRGLVFDDAGAPVVGAEVRAMGSTHQRKDGVSDFSNGNAETDAGGAFAMCGLVGKKVQLRVRADGYRTANKGYDTEKPEVLRFVLSRCAELAGRVLDRRGVGVAGAKLEVFATALGKDGVVSYQTPKDKAETDSKGSFVLAAVPPGKVWVRISGTCSTQVEGPIELRPAQQRGKLIFRVSRGPALDVEVRAGDGQVLAGAEVVLRRVVAKKVNPWERPKPHKSESDQAGKVRFAGLRPGEYELFATHPQQVLAALHPVSVAAEDRKLSAVLRLQEGGFLLARVRDSADLPRGDQMVLAHGASRTEAAGRTDASGRVRLGPLSPGTIDVALGRALPGHVERVIGTWASPGDAAGEIGSRQAVKIEAGRSTEVELRFPACATLTGVVLQEGVALGDQTIHLYPLRKTGGSADLYSRPGQQRSKTDGQGGFTFRDVEPGEYLLIVRPPDTDLPTRIPVEVVGTGVQRARVDIDLVDLRIEVSCEGEPVAGLELRLMPGGEGSSVGTVWPRPKGARSPGRSKTDSQGVARFTGLPPGSYRLRLPDKAYRVPKAQRSLRVTAAGGASRKLEIRRSARLAVISEKQGVLQVSVAAADGAGGYGQARSHWISAKANTLSLDAGRYRVRARKAGQADAVWTAWQDVELKVGKVAELRFDLR